MTMDQISVNFTCRNCGCTVVSIEDDANDQSVVSCRDCKTEFCTYGELKAKARDMAAAEMKKAFRKSFSGLKGWKLKT